MDEEFFIPDEEYETQFFGFCPSDMFEGVQALIKNRFEDAINKAEKQMTKIPPSVLSEQELEEGMRKLRSSTQENINDTLIKLKKHLLQNIMKIPPSRLLPEDDEQSDKTLSDEEYRSLKEEIEKIKTELKKDKLMEAVLMEELKDIELVRESQKAFLETEFSPSTQIRFEDDKDKLTFLASNAGRVEDAFVSLRRKGKSVLDEEKAVLGKGIFEAHVMQ